jgi:dTDP-4-amino-4,6-dideoxygalactose transaminase
LTRAFRSIPIAAPTLGEEEWQALREPLESGWLTQGPKVAEFEAAFAARHRVKHARATTSCTTALHLALASLGIGPGDEVIVPAFTWVATANAVVYCRATPVFVDVDPGSYNIDPAGLEGAITERTKAVIPVHLFGLCAEMEAIRAVVPQGIPLIEDAACAAGAEYHGRPAGGLGAVGAFSFHPRKSITTGEGGMLTTDDDELAARFERLRNHGASRSEEARHVSDAPWVLPAFEEVGFNYRMTDLQAAVGIVQLGRLDRFVDERHRWARWYAAQLADLGWLRPPRVPDGYRHAWQAFVTVVGEDAPMERDRIMAALQERGIATRPGTHAVPSLGVYRREYGTDPRRYPQALMLERRTLALPLHNRMTEDDYAYVVHNLGELQPAEQEVRAE